MIIIGYREPVDWGKVKASLKKCTTMTASDIEKLVKTVKSGNSMSVIEDFVLREELKDLNILVK